MLQPLSCYSDVAASRCYTPSRSPIGRISQPHRALRQGLAAPAVRGAPSAFVTLATTLDLELQLVTMKLCRGSGGSSHLWMPDCVEGTSSPHEACLVPRSFWCLARSGMSG